MCWGSEADNGADEAREREEARQGRVDASYGKIDEIFGGYDPKTATGKQFYDDRRSDYMGWATPQIERNRDRAFEDLRASLARAGISQSSIASDKRAEGEALMRQAMVDATTKADDHAGTIQSNLADAEANLRQQAAVLADVDQISNMAMAQSRAKSQPPLYDPVLDVFGELTANLSTQADLERRKQARYPSGLFGQSRSDTLIRS